MSGLKVSPLEETALIFLHWLHFSKDHLLYFLLRTSMMFMAVRIGIA